jgi:virulence-associated protein VagC
MDLEGVREALLKRPFEPFNIRLADGRSLAVRHPEMVAVGKRRIVVVQPDDSTLFIEPLLIVSLDFNGERSAQSDRREKDDT